MLRYMFNQNFIELTAAVYFVNREKANKQKFTDDAENNTVDAIADSNKLIR